MNRTLLNIIIDLLATLLFLGMIATGYLLRFPLPPGSNKTHVLWGLTRHQWGDIHFWISAGLLLTMLVHLALHWNWIVTVIGKRCGLVKSQQPSLIRSAILTLLVFTMLCIGFAWLVDMNVQQIDHPRRGRGASSPTAIDGVPPESNPTESSVAESKPLIWSDVAPIFQKHCIGCHGPQRQWADFRVDRPQDFIKQEKPWITPGQPERSPLIAIISGLRNDMAMADSHRLPEEDVSRIKIWIAQGAK